MRATGSAWCVRLGAGVAQGTISDTRTAHSLTATDGAPFRRRPARPGAHRDLVLPGSPRCAWASASAATSRSSAGVGALTLISLSPRKWDATQPVRAGDDGYGSFAADPITSSLILAEALPPASPPATTSDASMATPRIAVVGHVEHVGRRGLCDQVPAAGDIAHLREPRFLPGGGGGIAFSQLCRSDAELHLFTALGSDDGGEAVARRLAASRPGVHVHAARREADHPRVVVLVDTGGRRTILVTGDPLQPAASDPPGRSSRSLRRCPLHRDRPR